MRIDQLTEMQKRRIRVARMSGATSEAIASIVYNTPETVRKWVEDGRKQLWGDESEGPWSPEADLVLNYWDVPQDELDLALMHLTTVLLAEDSQDGSKNSASSAIARIAMNLERVYQDKPPVLNDADGDTLD